LAERTTWFAIVQVEVADTGHRLGRWRRRDGQPAQRSETRDQRDRLGHPECVGYEPGEHCAGDETGAAPETVDDNGLEHDARFSRPPSSTTRV
jgi:hypothetical protein